MSKQCPLNKPTPGAEPPGALKPCNTALPASCTCYHDSGDDGDEGIAVGQQPVGRLGAAVAVSVGRSDAPRERGGGGSCVAPRALLLHLIVDVVLNDVAGVVPLHGGGATGRQRTQRGPWTQPAWLFANTRTAAVGGRGNRKHFPRQLPVVSKDRLLMTMRTTWLETEGILYMFSP